jgi:hypothetical protein
VLYISSALNLDVQSKSDQVAKKMNSNISHCGGFYFFPMHCTQLKNATPATALSSTVMRICTWGMKDIRKNISPPMR